MKQSFWLIVLIPLLLSLQVLADGHTLPYEETFESFGSGWEVGEDSDGSSMYDENGGYNLQINTRDKTRRVVVPITVPDGYIAQIKLKVASGIGTYSLGFNYVGGNGYDLTISPNQQQYQVKQYQSGQYVKKLQNGQSGAIKRNDYNVIKVAIVKNHAQLFANGQLLTAITLEYSSNSMSLGICASNVGNEPLVVHIERFSVIEAKNLPEVKETAGHKDFASLNLAMVRVPGAAQFPTDDSGGYTTVDYSYDIGKTEVTYQQWKTVYDWALGKGYTFANPGQPGTYTSGHEDQPVTKVSWRDCIVWCNALTEYSNAMAGTDYSCVYLYNGNVIRNAMNVNACDNVDTQPNQKGFRLPTSVEWELAARYIDGNRWTPRDYASGASGPYSDRDATGAVAWYEENSGYTTHSVGTKKPNALGIYDMSGNVWEWCFDRQPENNGFRRVNRGLLMFSFRKQALMQQMKIASRVVCGHVGANSPSDVDSFIGFRLVRSDTELINNIGLEQVKLSNPMLDMINAEEEEAAKHTTPHFGAP